MLTGTWTALITPFKDQKVDCLCLKQLVDQQRIAGIDGLVLLGTTGEAFSLESDERATVIKIAKERAGPHLPLWVGCGAPSTKATLQNARQAQELGADGVMIVTPPYVKPNAAGMKEHIFAICDNAQLPVMLYNNPARCGRSLSADLILELCRHKGVIAIKESGGDLQQIAHIMLKKPERISLLAGDDTLLYPMLALGAGGVVSVSSNLLPRDVKELVDALLTSQLAIARRRFAALFPLLSALGEETNPIAVKYLMHRRQLCSASVRCPLGPIDLGAQRRIDALLPEIFSGDL